MMRIEFKKCMLVIISVLLMVLPAGSAQSRPVTMKVSVKTILASHNQNYEDKRIPQLIKKLKSIFGYSSYRLLSHKEIKTRIHKQDIVLLPGKRVLRIVPTKVIKSKTGYRLELHLAILKENQQIFQTVIKLKNKSSVTVGGPKHEGGVLLFNIYTEF